MNLKQFHIVFIVLSAGMCLWLFGWGVAHRSETLGAALAGIGSAGFFALAAYLRHFLRANAKGQNGLHPKLAVLVAAALSARASDAGACTICMGQPDAKVARAYQFGIAFMAVLVLGTLFGIAYMMIKAIREHDNPEWPLPLPR